MFFSARKPSILALLFALYILPSIYTVPRSYEVEQPTF